MMTKDGLLLSVLLAVGTGAALGAMARWALSYLLNAKLATLPLGTLSANLLGGWLIGITLAWTAAHPGLPPAVRLFIVTGFLGGLTTFSTFSAESVGLILKGMVGPALLHAGLHLGGSLLACFAGVKTGHWIRAVLGG